MNIFKKVFLTFLKTLALYAIWIFAFALAFRILTDSSYYVNNIFESYFTSFVKTVRMMLGDFGSFNLDPEDWFDSSILMLFVLLIIIVLLSLLNALAITDTNEIMKEAELITTKKRISIFKNYESIFRLLSKVAFGFSLKFGTVFPEHLTIVFKPHETKTSIINNDIRKKFIDFIRKQTMDS